MLFGGQLRGRDIAALERLLNAMHLARVTSSVAVGSSAASNSLAGDDQYRRQQPHKAHHA